MALLGGAAELEQPTYAVLVDRISHEVPYYRAHLKGAALMGTGFDSMKRSLNNE